jgi:hypothetical protein
MESFEAEEALAGVDLVPAVEAGIPDAKRLVERCLDQDIPATIGRNACCASGGCTPKAQVLVRQEDVARVRALVHGDWLRAAEREGTIHREWLEKQRATEDSPDGYPPCPACGTAAPLVNGACSDCGLQLE